MIDRIEETNISYCLECGKCTGSCPISRLNREYSPRMIVKRALMGFENEIFMDRELWSCLACNVCKERCPSDVDYPAFIRAARAEALKEGKVTGTCAHEGIIFSLMKIMKKTNIKQNRLNWAKDMEISNKGELLYFVGCLPYFDPIFRDIGMNSLDIARSTVQILNRVGIKPVVMNNEKCCGHDMLWTGDSESFEDLARQNVNNIKETGAKKIVMTCPECYKTFKIDYPEYVDDLGFEVIHISEFLAELIDEGKIRFEFGGGARKITYQDPCRLGRHLGIYDEPREVIGNVPGIELVEMDRNRENAMCCGTSAWINCDRFSKQMQINRLKEAKSTGADMLVTACPKCQIHLKCAMSGELPVGKEEVEIEINDLSVLVARGMGIHIHG
jgi:Fe-S oxidoreductase